MARFGGRMAMLCGVGLALSACVGISPAERRAGDEAQCRSYGFRAGTDSFASCLQRIDLSRAADRRAFLASDPFPRQTIIYRPILVR